MFRVSNRAIADVEPFVWVPSEATLTLGMAAYIASGALAKATTTTKPTHIVMGAKKDGKYPCIVVQPTTVFETTATATVAATVVGSAVTIHTDGLQVTATTTSGVFTVDYTDAKTGGGVVRGHFA